MYYNNTYERMILMSNLDEKNLDKVSGGISAHKDLKGILLSLSENKVYLYFRQGESRSMIQRQLKDYLSVQNEVLNTLTFRNYFNRDDETLRFDVIVILTPIGEAQYRVNIERGIPLFS